MSHATDGTVGVAAIHIESGRSVNLHGAEPFPMASAFKLPVAIQILSLVDEGKLTLDKMVTVTPADLHPGSGKLTELFIHPGLSLSIANLMELALVISDNSAADLLLREAGGPAAVTARMRALGLAGIRVDRSTALLLADWQGVKTSRRNRNGTAKFGTASSTPYPRPITCAPAVPKPPIRAILLRRAT